MTTALLSGAVRNTFEKESQVWAINGSVKSRSQKSGPQ
jgi:hypothetical protein